MTEKSLGMDLWLELTKHLCILVYLHAPNDFDQVQLVISIYKIHSVEIDELIMEKLGMFNW